MDDDRTLTDEQIETTVGQHDSWATADVDADDADTDTDDTDTDDTDVDADDADM